jgi:ketosteroid isomerase-like protein
VATTVDRFHAALAAGDSATAITFLADDAVILESGTRESRDDYRAHHLAADIAFARAVPRRRGDFAVQVSGDVAWVTGTSTSQGEYRGRPVNSAGAELIVLTRASGGWRIRAIHWSSRTKG